MTIQENITLANIQEKLKRASELLEQITRQKQPPSYTDIRFYINSAKAFYLSAIGEILYENHPLKTALEKEFQKAIKSPPNMMKMLLNGRPKQSSNETLG